MEVFADPGPDETHDEYYRRQIRSTRNFLRSPQLDSVLQRILEEEVPFDDRPDFRIFYGGLDTHIEHHLFPDLPPNRQREVAPRVKEIVTRYGLPYHQTPLGETAALLFKTLTGLSIPVGERESGHPLMLLKRQAGLARRVTSGVRYRRLPDAPYLDKPRWYNVPVRVVATEQLAHGQALTIRLERPRGWDDVCWDPGPSSRQDRARRRNAHPPVQPGPRQRRLGHHGHLRQTGAGRPGFQPVQRRTARG